MLDTVRSLVRGLDGDELAQRDAAEKKLIEFGPSVLKLLPEVTPKTSGELKIRLQRIREQLQKQSVGNFFKESVVSLRGKMNVADSIAEISKQSGNMIELSNAEGAATIEIEWNHDKVAFWAVMADLMKQAKLGINPYGQFDGLSLMADQRADVPKSTPIFTQGPFRVDTISTQTTVNYQSEQSGQLDVSLLVTWEPRLKPVFLQIPMGKVKATFSSESNLTAISPEAAPEVPINGTSCSTQIDLSLGRPPRSAQKIDTLKGEFVVAVPSEKHKYVFEKFANGARQTQKYGDVTVILENARRNNRTYEMRILTDFKDAQGALDSYRGWILSNRAYMLDEKDNRLENIGLNTYPGSNNSIGVAYVFQLNSDPNTYKLVYESPAMITRQTISFELKDIDLP